jgi:hypothetical protein
VLLVSAVAFGLGYRVYVYCILPLARERRSPYPVWMHTFYLAGLVATCCSGLQPVAGKGAPGETDTDRRA